MDVTDNKFYKCTDTGPPRTAWDASVTLGKENAVSLINSMFEEISKTAKKLPKSADLNNCPIVSKQNDYALRTLYRRDHDRSKTTKCQFEKHYDLTTKQQRIPPQHTNGQQHPQMAAAQHGSSNQHKHNNPICTKLNITKQRRRLKNIKSTHANKPPFLYEHYPLRPALLYGNPLSFICDPLKRLNQIPYLPSPSSLLSITSVHPQIISTADIVSNSLTSRVPINCVDDLKKIRGLNAGKVEKKTNTIGSPVQHARLKSGREVEYKNKKAGIAQSALQTTNAYGGKSELLENVCPTCHRNAFLVPRDSEYDMDITIAFDELDKTENLGNPMRWDKVYKNTLPTNDNVKVLRKVKRQEVAEPEENDQRVQLTRVSDADEKQLSSAQLSASGNSLDLDYYASVPIFEVLDKNYFKNYANQPSLKQRDSLLFYKDLKQKQKRKSCLVNNLDVREGKPTGFVRFFDEVHLEFKPSDEDIVFGSAKGLHDKQQSWEQSRIDWLGELERRHEVRRRRQKRQLEHNASESYLEKCSLLCQRLRMWLAKWTQ